MNIPLFISEGHIHDIGAIQRQADRQKNGETVSYLFSDQITASVGQWVFLEVSFKEALPEKDNEKVKTVVSHLEGQVTKVDDQIVATIRVVEKPVKELEGDWVAVLYHDKNSDSNKWRLDSLTRKPSENGEIPSDPPQSLEELPLKNVYAQQPLSLAQTFIQHQSVLPDLEDIHNSEKRDKKRSSADGEETKVKKKKKSSSPPPGPIFLSPDVIQKLQEFKNKYKDCDAIANWDISQYAAPDPNLTQQSQNLHTSFESQATLD